MDVKIAVVGSAGFLGRTLVDQMPSTVETVGIDLIRRNESDLIVDIEDLEALTQSLSDVRPSVVVHLAYLLAEATEGDAARATGVNVVGTNNVLEAARLVGGVERVVMTSSVAVYGNRHQYDPSVPVAEPAHGRANTMYGWMKQFNEAMATHYATTHGLPTVSLRVSSVIGRGRMAGTSSVFSRLLDAVCEGGRTVIEGVAEQRAALIHTTDVARALVALTLAERPAHDVYNSGGQQTTVREMLEIVDELVPGAEIELRRPAHPARDIELVCAVDSSRLEDEYGLSRTSLRSLIQDEVTRAQSAEPDDLTSSA